MFPPEGYLLDNLFQLGYTDTQKWLRENGHRFRDGSMSPERANPFSPTAKGSAPQPALKAMRAVETDADSPVHQATSDSETDGSGHVHWATSDTDDESPSPGRNFRFAACEAPSCDETFKEAVVGESFLLMLAA